MEIQRKDVVDGLGKGLQVIEAFDQDHPRLTASETAERVGITRTAARRTCTSCSLRSCCVIKIVRVTCDPVSRRRASLTTKPPYD